MTNTFKKKEAEVIHDFQAPVMREEVLDHQLTVIRDIIYPGAKLETVKLVWEYCKNLNLDPMLKPVHIVPMSKKTGKKIHGEIKKKDENGHWITTQGEKDEYETIDTLMPGIGLYRIMATRSGQYAGISEAQFGPLKKYPGITNTDVPEWCKMTVKRVVQGQICEFSVIEYWLENYATESKFSNKANEVWSKRSRGQLSKVTEAQALRRAFPDTVGSIVTFEEMEDKQHFIDSTNHTKQLLQDNPTEVQIELPKDKTYILDYTEGLSVKDFYHLLYEYIESISSHEELIDYNSKMKANINEVNRFSSDNPDLEDRLLQMLKDKTSKYKINKD